MAEKIGGMMDKSYLEAGRVQTYLYYFAVPKGDTDIRVGFDGTSCSLNGSLWSPKLFPSHISECVRVVSFRLMDG